MHHLNKTDNTHQPHKSPVLSLRLGFSWTLLGNIVSQVCMWGIISCYNKIGSSDDAGLYFLALAIMQPLFHLTDFSLRQIYVTDTHNRWEFRDYLGHRLIWSVIGLVIGVSIAFLCYRHIPSLVNATLLLGIAIAGQSLSEMLHAFFQKENHFDTIAWSLILRGLISLIFVGATFFVTRSVLLSLVMLCVTRFAVVILYDFPQAQRQGKWQKNEGLSQSLKPRFSMRTFLAISVLGLPLALNMGMLSLVPQIPRFWLEHTTGSQSVVGKFGSISALMAVGLMIVNSLGVAMSQRFAKAYAAKDRRRFFRLTALLVGAAGGMGCIGLVLVPFCGSLILTLAYTSEYADQVSLFWVMMLGATFSFVGHSLGYPVTAGREFRIQPVICLVQTLVTMIGCYFLVPHYGTIGAAWAVAMANFCHATLFAMVYYRVYTFNGEKL